jgi:chaperonin cofactor prefoldin
MSALKIEIENIEKKIHITQERLDEIDADFWESGGTSNCCHCCFSYGEWDRLQDLQRTREDRIKQLQDKIERSVTI